MGIFKNAMNIEIKPVHYDFHSCEEDITVSVAKFLKKDWQLMYCNAWGFSYDRTAKSIGEALHESKSDFLRNLERYHGVFYREQKVFSSEQVDYFLYTEQRKNLPVVYYMDEFDCTWSPFYCIRHKPHPVVLVEKTEEGYRCLDPYLTQERKYLSKTILDLYPGTVLCIRKKDVKTPYSLFPDIIVQAARQMQQSGLCQMQEFIQCMGQMRSLEQEIKENNGRICSDLLDKITYLSRRRMQYVQFLTYLNKKITINKNLQEAFTDLSVKWNIIGKKIIKAYCTGTWNSLQREDTVKQLYVCHACEKAVADTIVQDAKSGGK